MKIAFVQFAPAFGDAGANVDRALALAGREPADLYVFPELFNTGYQFRGRDELAALAEAADGATVGRLAGWCRERGVVACAGFAERDSDRVYNSAALVGPAGLVGVYRKAHLFWREKDLFDVSPEDGFRVYDVGGVRVGVMVCFDWIFPEAARILALRGAQLILHPANLVLRYCPAAMVTRCLENRVFAVTAGRTGAEDRWDKPLRFIGGSRIISPAGEVLARADDEEEAVGVADVNPADADDKHITPRNDLFADRRVDLYGELCR